MTVPSKLISWCVWADKHTVGGSFALNNDPADLNNDPADLNNDPADLANLTAPLVAAIEN